MDLQVLNEWEHKVNGVYCKADPVTLQEAHQ